MKEASHYTEDVSLLNPPKQASKMATTTDSSKVSEADDFPSPLSPGWNHLTVNPSYTSRDRGTRYSEKKLTITLLLPQPWQERGTTRTQTRNFPTTASPSRRPYLPLPEIPVYDQQYRRHRQYTRNMHPRVYFLLPRAKPHILSTHEWLSELISVFRILPMPSHHQLGNRCSKI